MIRKFYDTYLEGTGGEPHPSTPAGKEGAIEYQIGFYRHPDEDMVWSPCSKKEYDECNKVGGDCRIKPSPQSEQAGEREELAKILEPFVKMCNELTSTKIRQGGNLFGYNNAWLTVEDLLRAKMFYHSRLALWQAASQEKGVGAMIEKVTVQDITEQEFNSDCILYFRNQSGDLIQIESFNSFKEKSKKYTDFYIQWLSAPDTVQGQEDATGFAEWIASNEIGFHDGKWHCPAKEEFIPLIKTTAELYTLFTLTKNS